MEWKIDRFEEFILPPLCERPTDALVLLAHFWSERVEKPAANELRITLFALKRFLASSFEGDLRRLARATVERLYKLTQEASAGLINDDIMRRALTGRTESATVDESAHLVFTFGDSTQLEELVQRITDPTTQTPDALAPSA